MSATSSPVPPEKGAFAPAEGRSLRFALPLLALGTLALHVAASGNYGFFRDELYYMACGRHLAWGYVDQPPLIAFVAWLERLVMGDSMLAARLLPALAGAGLVYLTGWMARELGGRRIAQILAAVAVLFAPAVLALDGFLSMNAFEPLLWLGAACILLRILKGANRHWWLAFGVVCGVGLLNKHTMLVFGFGMVFGLLLGGERRQFAGRWIWLAAGIALLIFLPNLIWEARHGWPQFEVVRHAREFKNFPISHVEFLFEQVLFLGPLAVPVWLAGLLWYLRAPEARRFRCFGWAFLVILVVNLGLRGKTYYMVPAYPMQFAAGGVALEGLFIRTRRWWLAPAYVAVLVVCGLLVLPFAVPILPVNILLDYQQRLPIPSMVRTERDPVSALPQLYADMFGWPEMAATIAGVYQALPPEDRAKCAILAGNYGEAGALDEYGPQLGLPPAISGHNNYWLWGPRGYSGEVVILFGREAEPYKKYFAEVEPVAVIRNPYAMAVENDVKVYLCRKPVASLSQLWPLFKLYI